MLGLRQGGVPGGVACSRNRRIPIATGTGDGQSTRVACEEVQENRGGTPWPQRASGGFRCSASSLAFVLAPSAIRKQLQQVVGSCVVAALELQWQGVRRANARWVCGRLPLYASDPRLQCRSAQIPPLYAILPTSCTDGKLSSSPKAKRPGSATALLIRSASARPFALRASSRYCSTLLSVSIAPPRRLVMVILRWHRGTDLGAYGNYLSCGDCRKLRSGALLLKLGARCVWGGGGRGFYHAALHIAALQSICGLAYTPLSCNDYCFINLDCRGRDGGSAAACAPGIAHHNVRAASGAAAGANTTCRPAHGGGVCRPPGRFQKSARPPSLHCAAKSLSRPSFFH